VPPQILHDDEAYDELDDQGDQNIYVVEWFTCMLGEKVPDALLWAALYLEIPLVKSALTRRVWGSPTELKFQDQHV